MYPVELLSTVLQLSQVTEAKLQVHISSERSLHFTVFWVFFSIELFTFHCHDLEPLPYSVYITFLLIALYLKKLILCRCYRIGKNVF